MEKEKKLDCTSFREPNWCIKEDDYCEVREETRPCALRKK
jgi:hypothetical protein